MYLSSTTLSALLSSLIVDGRIPFVVFWNSALRALACLLPIGLYLTNDFKVFGSLAFGLLTVIALLHPLADVLPEIRLLRTLIGIRRSFGILAAMAALTHGLGFFYIHDTFSLAALTRSQYWAWDGLYLYGLIGMLASIPLLLTSNNLSVRLLGGYWQIVQKLMYVMFYTACVHVALTGHALDITPLLLGVGVVALRILAARGVRLHIVRFLPFLRAG